MNYKKNNYYTYKKTTVTVIYQLFPCELCDKPCVLCG